MKFKSFIIADRGWNLTCFLASVFSICAMIVFTSGNVIAQRLAILTPDERSSSQAVAELIKDALSDRFRIEDLDLVRTAAETVKIESPYNLSVSDARAVGAVVGAPYIILIKTGELRRTSADVEEYYEAFAAVYIVHSSSGSLIDWKLFSVTGASPELARTSLDAEPKSIANHIAESIAANEMNARSKVTINRFPPMPKSASKDPDALKPPMPYRRIRPDYAPTANLYSVRATVEIEVDIDAEGRIVNTEIVRWAGFGLDECVIETVRKMNWRPATIGNRTLPMRVLLRYNFVKIDKDEDR